MNALARGSQIGQMGVTAACFSLYPAIPLAAGATVLAVAGRFGHALQRLRDLLMFEDEHLSGRQVLGVGIYRRRAGNHRPGLTLRGCCSRQVIGGCNTKAAGPAPTAWHMHRPLASIETLRAAPPYLSFPPAHGLGLGRREMETLGPTCRPAARQSGKYLGHLVTALAALICGSACPCCALRLLACPRAGLPCDIMAARSVTFGGQVYG